MNINTILPNALHDHVLGNDMSFSVPFLWIYMDAEMFTMRPWSYKLLTEWRASKQQTQGFLSLNCPTVSLSKLEWLQPVLIGDNSKFSDFGHKELNEENTKHFIPVFFHLDSGLSKVKQIKNQSYLEINREMHSTYLIKHFLFISENLQLSRWGSWRNSLSQIPYIYVPKVNTYMHMIF